MSKKILIDEDVLEALIDSASFEARYYRLYQGYGDFSDRVYAQIAKAEKAIEESKEKHYSVLEWHPMSEKPETGRIILVRHRDKSVPFDVYKVGAFILDCFDYKYANVKEWAYLDMEQTA